MAKRNIYSDFVDGAGDGLKTAVKILPTLVGLMVAVGVLRASGFLDWIAGWIGKLSGSSGISGSAGSAGHCAPVFAPARLPAF